jgi:pterin-4a-carbinolamine dehydratase
VLVCTKGKKKKKIYSGNFSVCVFFFNLVFTVASVRVGHSPEIVIIFNSVLVLVCTVRSNHVTGDNIGVYCLLVNFVPEFVLCVLLGVRGDL